MALVNEWGAGQPLGWLSDFVLDGVCNPVFRAGRGLQPRP
jgi:hypothetical protein